MQCLALDTDMDSDSEHESRSRKRMMSDLTNANTPERARYALGILQLPIIYPTDVCPYIVHVLISFFFVLISAGKRMHLYWDDDTTKKMDFLSSSQVCKM